MDNSRLFENRKVLVVGLGKSGTAAARLLQLLSAQVTVTDIKEEQFLTHYMKALPNSIKVRVGRTLPSSSLLDGIDMLVVSPGVTLKQHLIKDAKERGVEVIGEVELAYRAIKLYRIPWIAISGTNGKSTTTKLVDLMLQRAGFRVITGGNIGIAITELIQSQIEGDVLERVDYVVVELSSFQLEGIKEFRPSIAAILNITPDHLDRYNSMEEYLQAKANIFINQTSSDRLILNFDDPLVRRLGSHAISDISYFSRSGFFASLNDEFNGMNSKSAILRDGWIHINSPEEQKRVIKSDEIIIKGVHNIENALAASLIAYHCGIDIPVMKGSLQEFKGLKHRVELSGEIRGVKFYNDSKGTNIGAVIKALESFDRGVILILGGKDKGGDFSALREYIIKSVKGIVAIGEAKAKITKRLGDIVLIVEAEDMNDAVKKAFSMAERGDAVLLSPGCASFDMFNNFEERGEAFKEAVNNIMRSKGYRKV